MDNAVCVKRAYTGSVHVDLEGVLNTFTIWFWPRIFLINIHPFKLNISSECIYIDFFVVVVFELESASSEAQIKLANHCDMNRTEWSFRY